MPGTDIILAGATAAFTVSLLIYPFDTLKTRLQEASPGTSAARKTFWQNPQLYKGLYQGIGSVLVATAPAAGVFFTTYEFLLSHTSSAVVSSSLAEVCCCAIITPAEVIKQNAQALSHTTHTSHARTCGGLGISFSSLQAFRHIPVTHLWRGYSALVGRNLPFTAMQFPVFEALKKRLLDRESSPLQTGVGAGVSAGVAGCVAAVITTPADVVKTKVMLYSGDGKHGSSTRKRARHEMGAFSERAQHRRKGALTVVKDVVREEGWKGLMRGGLMRGGWTAVGSGLYLGSYEAAKVWLRKGSEAEQEKIAI